VSSQLSFSQPVARELVHKHAISEVFPTDLVTLSPHNFLAAVTWPRRHAFFGCLTEEVDIHLVTETARQLMVLTSHSFYDIPLGTPFIGTKMAITLRTHRATPEHHHTKQLTEVKAHIHVSDIRYNSHGIIRRHTTTTRFECDIQTFAYISITTLFIDPDIYFRLRDHKLQSDVTATQERSDLVPPEAVGFTHPSDVVLKNSSQPNQFLLAPDFHNPYLFDHPVDHIPAMTLLEACRQLIRATTKNPQALIDNATIKFIQPIELDHETIIRHHNIKHKQTSIEFIQGNNVCAQAKVYKHTNNVLPAPNGYPSKD
jgi:hypothetical protein